MSVVVNLTGQPVQVSVGQRNAPGGAASLLDVNRVVTVAGTRTIKQDASLSVAAGVVTGAVSIRASGSDGLALINSTGTTVATIGAGPGTGTTFAGGVNAAAITSTSASGVTTLQAATQDAVRILGRAGGTASRTLTITTAALGADRTVTFPDAAGTVALLSVANVFTGAITVPNGTAAAPGIRLTSAASGLYADGGDLGFAGSGVASMRLFRPVAAYNGGIDFQTVADNVHAFITVNNNAAELRVAAGINSTSGANIRLFGSAHTTPNVGRLFIAGTQVLEWTSTDITAGRPITVPDGTAAAPGIRLTSEASGMYRASSTDLGLSVAGIRALSVRAPNGAIGGRIFFWTTTAAEHGAIFMLTTNTYNVFGSSTGSADGGQLRAYGNTHATKANFVEFTRGNTVSAFFDGSGNLTCSGTVTVPNGTAAAPGIRLTGEASGLYRHSSISLGAAVGGALSVAIYAPASGLYGCAMLMANPAADQPGVLGNIAANSYVAIYGGASLAGGSLRCYGTSHATKANFVEFLRGATVSASFDASGNLSIATTTASTSTTTGALTVAGGVGVAGAVHAGGVTITGSAPGTPSAGQVLIGGGEVKAAGGVSCASVDVADAGHVYLRGDASTDGSVRFSSQSAGTMLIEKRASGSWVSIGSFA